MTDTVGHVTSNGYDGTGAQRWSTGPDGRITLMVLDGLGRVVQTIANYDDGAVGGSEPVDQDLISATVYDAAGRRLQAIDSAGQVTQFAYDNLDRLITVTENAVTGSCVVAPCNVETTYGYDRAGNRTSITDANTHTRTFEYDAADRQVVARDALNQVTTWDYDRGGRPLVQHDPRGTDYDLTYTSDQLDHTTVITAVLLTTPITSTYDPLGRRTHLGDESGITSFTYDALNRVTAVAAPNTGTVGYGYDARGLRTRLTYPDSIAIDYTYYDDGKLAGVWQGATQLAGYTYTPLGQPYQVTRAITATTTYSYDNAGRLTELQTLRDSDTLTDFAYTLDRRGLRTNVAETWAARDSADVGTGSGLYGEYYSDPSLGTLVLTRTDSLVDVNWGSGSPDISVPSDGFSVRWSGTVQPRYTEPYTFTTTADDGVRLWVNDNLLIDDWTSHGTEVHSGVTPAALTAGQQYTITLEYFEDASDAEVHLAWQSARQSFDNIATSQLYPPGVSAPQPLVTTMVTRTVDYSYDGLQRLTGAAETPGTVYTYTYDLAGNRTEVWQNGVQMALRGYNDANQDDGYSYDAAGNLLSDGTTDYTYDPLNRMTSLTNGGQTRTNLYNGDGVLVAQDVLSTTTRYTQDLAAPLSQILGDGSARYAYGQERLFGDAGSARTWYLGDALGSVRLTLGDDAEVASVAKYDSWGIPQTLLVMPFGFTGELQQGSEIYLRARWYQAEHGNFVSKDVWQGDPQQPDTLQGFSYTANNPVNRVDPSGHDWNWNWNLVHNLREPIIKTAKFHARPADNFSWEVIATLMAAHIARERREEIGIWNWGGDVAHDLGKGDNASTGLANMRPQGVVQIYEGRLPEDTEGKFNWPLQLESLRVFHDCLSSDGVLDESDYGRIYYRLRTDNNFALDILGANIERGIDRSKRFTTPSVFNVGNWLWNGAQEPARFWKTIAGRGSIISTDGDMPGYSHGVAMVQIFDTAAREIGLYCPNCHGMRSVNLYNETRDPNTDESVLVRCEVRAIKYGWSQNPRCGRFMPTSEALAAQYGEQIRRLGLELVRFP